MENLMFTYDPIDLDRPSFRLVQLLHGTDHVIECKLIQAFQDGSDTIPYEALSYAWGQNQKTDRINMNGKWLDVTQNLHLVLRKLRYTDVDRILWVDALCINQQDNKEKNHQIEQMGKIYSNAERVIFWLGRSAAETDLVMEALQSLYAESKKQALSYQDWKPSDKRWEEAWSELVRPRLASRQPDLDSKLRKGTQELLGRPWFKRVWILQEVANAKQAVVYCGRKSLSARIFAMAAYLFSAWTVSLHCRAVLDIMPGPSRNLSWFTHSPDLLTLLSKFSESEATDPRDKIFALLGISSDARADPRLCANYEKSVDEVVGATIEFIYNKPSIKPIFPLSRSSQPTKSPRLTVLDTCLPHISPTGAFETLARWGDEEDIMELFLKVRAADLRVTENVVVSAVQNAKNGVKLMKLLLKSRSNEVVITERVVRAMLNNAESGREIIQNLFPSMGAEIVQAAGKGGNLINRLLKQLGHQYHIDGELAHVVGRNTWFSADVITRFLGTLVVQSIDSEIQTVEFPIGDVVEPGMERVHERYVGLLERLAGNRQRVYRKARVRWDYRRILSTYDREPTYS